MEPGTDVMILKIFSLSQRVLADETLLHELNLRNYKS
jgi:hypothetical protein